MEELMTFEPIEHEPDDYEAADTPARPSAGRTGAFPRRFWRALTGRPTGPICRPVIVQGADGEPVHTAVLGDVPMSDESRAALGEIVRAAQRKYRARMAAERQAADDDVRAVVALLDATAEDAQPRTWTASRAMVRARFADRIAALEARDTKGRCDAMSDTTPEPTADARLAQIRDRNRRLTAIAMDTSAANHVMRDMIDSIGDVQWLLAEQKRLSDELAGVHAQLRTELAISKLLLQDKDELTMHAHHAEVRAETAKRKLAEMREQHQPGPHLRAWRKPDGRYVHGEQDWIRESVKAHGGEHVTAETCSYVGAWKAAEQQPEDGDRG